MGSNEEYRSIRIPVPAEFDEVFSHFYLAENRSESTITKTLLPAYQTILIFCFGARASLQSAHGTRVEIDKCLVLGPVKQAFDYSLPPSCEILVANFKDDAFYRFFGDAAILGNIAMHPDELLEENCFTMLWQELKDMRDTPSRVRHILHFAKPYLKERDTKAERLASFSSETLNPIKSIAGEQGQTQRNIQLNHKKLLGFSAKEFSRYQRFIKAIRMIEQVTAKQARTDWFDIIVECGYYDQSQLIHDFKHYLHLTPTSYLKFQEDICNANV